MVYELPYIKIMWHLQYLLHTYLLPITSTILRAKWPINKFVAFANLHADLVMTNEAFHN